MTGRHDDTHRNTSARNTTAVKPRNPREAAWWNNATPKERVAYFLGTMRGLGHTFPDPVHQQMLEHKLGVRKPGPQSSSIVRLRPPFDPTAPCNYPDCDKPIGEYQGGRQPIHCEAHRHLNRFKGPGMRRTKGTP